MTVLQEILEWSQDRPAWQRDALRRLVVNGYLSGDDIRALTRICKAAHGLADHQEFTPLSSVHVPKESDAAVPVSLVSIFHHRGVNALAEGQTLSFSPNLTVVYGDNAAGKTGYIRILKSACRARGQEEILGNVVSGTAPRSPIVAIKYRVGAGNEPREWAGDGEDAFVSRVSVFDTHCASVYLKEKTNVAFRPFGLDLFDQLVRACKAVRLQLEKEQRALASRALAAVQIEIPEGTAVSKLLAHITSLTKVETVQSLARLSTEEQSRLALLEESIRDLQAEDPQKLAQQFTLRAARVQVLARHITEVEVALSPEAVARVFGVRAEGRRTSERARSLRAATFPPGLLDGTGSETWTLLWDAARRFSQHAAYPGQDFPVVENGAHCLLCQQGFGDAARHRLDQFEAFVASTAETELRTARHTFAQLQRSFTDFKVRTESIDAILNELRIDHEAASAAIVSTLANAERRRQAVALALSDNTDLAPDSPGLVSVAGEIDTLLTQISERVNTLQTSANPETRKRMVSAAQELRARRLLGQYEQVVLDEIERKRQYAAYSLCIEDTKTQAITRKSTFVTRSAVTQQLKQSFAEELSRLGFGHVEVELREVGGAEGVLYHKLILTRAPGVDLPKVVSEGEQRCLSIAAFFAELSTADEPSGIVFDDPVSSLDYKWRENVARRLVEEAKTRQVVVFTHDVVFLLLIKQLAAEESVPQGDQHVRQLASGAGVCAEDLPWVALRVSKRVRHLRKLLQDATKLHRDGHQAAYETDATLIYGYLREAWERGLEEVLLGGVVERFRPGVQTQQVSLVADVSAEDCKAVETAMTKCSRWLPGHDQAPAARAEIPGPAAIKADIDALDNWVDAIRKRRK